MLENERYEDFLLDGDSTPPEREALHASAADDERLRVRLAQRQFIHGLLISQASMGTAAREQRLERALAAIRADEASQETLAADNQDGRVIQMQPRFWRSTAIAAAVTALMAIGAALYISSEPSPSKQLPDGEPVGQIPPEALAPNFHVVSGAPSHARLANGGWRVWSNPDKASTIRLPDGSVAVLARGSELTVDRDGRRVGVNRGDVTLEGRQLGVRIGSRDALLHGGPMVVSVDGGGASFANVLSGSLKDSDGVVICEGGQRVAEEGGGLKIQQVADPRLPEWAAEGRAEEFVDELEKMAGPGTQLDREAWVATLKIVLAEPVGRDLTAEFIKAMLESDLSQEELRGALEFMTAMNGGSQNARQQERLQQKMKEFSDGWQKATPEQREQIKAMIRMFFKAQPIPPEGRRRQRR